MRQHKCFRVVNEELYKYQTALDTGILGINQLFISTYKIPGMGTKSRKRPKKLVVASYCPFCGEKLEIETALKQDTASEG